MDMVSGAFSRPLREGEWTDQSLHVGVQFSDGRKAANFGRGQEPVQGPVPAGLVMRLLSLGGGRHFRNWWFWVSPLPPAGSLTFACEWAEFDIRETRADVDANLILETAGQSSRIWGSSKLAGTALRCDYRT